MSARHVRITLWSAAALCSFGGLLAVALAAQLPLDGVGGSSPGQSKPVVRSVRPSTQPADAEVWAIELRKPLTDSPAPAISEAPSAFVPAAMPALRIVGTVVEREHSIALIDIDARTQFKAVGDVVHGMRIDSISDAGCVVSFNGREVSVSIEKSGPVAGSAPSAGPYGDH